MTAYSSAKFIKSAHDPSDFLPDRGREVAFSGRSNAGKSSAINVITQCNALARISKTPGRTQLVNFFGLGEDRRLVDLPGYGFARVPDRVRLHWRGLMEAYFNERRCLAGVVVVMDSRRPLTEYDRQMLAWAEASDCPVHILLTKSDKISRGAAASALQKTRRELGDSATVQLFSALKRQGAEEARQKLDEWLFDSDP